MQIRPSGFVKLIEQRIGREPLDVARDAGNERDRAQRVRETARTGVLAEHVLDTVTARDLEVELPAPISIDLDRHDDRVGAGERVDAIRGERSR